MKPLVVRRESKSVPRSHLAKTRSPLVPHQANPSKQAGQPAAVHSAKTLDKSVMAGWLLLVIGCVSACFPGHGKLVLHNICYPLCGVAVIFGIAGAASGRPMAGMLLIFTSIVVPIALTVLNITELF